jgi:hypothetical protein
MARPKGEATAQPSVRQAAHPTFEAMRGDAEMAAWAHLIHSAMMKFIDCTKAASSNVHPATPAPVCGTSLFCTHPQTGAVVMSASGCLLSGSKLKVSSHSELPMTAKAWASVMKWKATV